MLNGPDTNELFIDLLRISPDPVLRNTTIVVNTLYESYITQRSGENGAAALETNSIKTIENNTFSSSLKRNKTLFVVASALTAALVALASLLIFAIRRRVKKAHILEVKNQNIQRNDTLSSGSSSPNGMENYRGSLHDAAATLSLPSPQLSPAMSAAMVIYGSNFDSAEQQLRQYELPELDCPHDESPVRHMSYQLDDDSYMSNAQYAFSVAPASTSISKSSKFTFSTEGDEDQSIAEMSHMSEQRFESMMMNGID